MLVFQYLYRYAPTLALKTVLLLVISSLSYAGLAIILTEAAEVVWLGETSIFRWVLAAILLLPWAYFLQKSYYRTAFQCLQKTMVGISQNLIDNILASSLEEFEHIHSLEIVEILDTDAKELYEFNYWFFAAISLTSRMLWLVLYIALSSVTLGLLVFIPIVLFALFFKLFILEGVQENRRKHASESSSFTLLLEDALKGAKETFLNKKRRNAIRLALSKGAEHTRDAQISFVRLVGLQHLYTPLLAYILSIVTVLAGGVFLAIDPLSLAKILALIFFLFYPISGIFWGIEFAVFIEQRFKRLRAMEKRFLKPPKVAQHTSKLAFQHQIELKNFAFSYPTKSGDLGAFGIGPFNLSIAKGEVVFLTGSNGSGKSTFLKSITGLYQWEGEIWVDGQKVNKDLWQDYQNLFSLVFTDFHIFDKLYGLHNISTKKVNLLIKLMQLRDKTKFDAIRNSFSNTESLSTGQRKRLALLITLLEKKEFYILDEVAADQDPEQKRFFYQFILDEMRKAGKTVLVVSHEANFFEFADRILEIKNGIVKEIVNKTLT